MLVGGCEHEWVVCCAGVLVDLLTLEVQSYGEESMAGARVVEHAPAGPVTVTCSSVPMPQPAAATAVAATPVVMGPPLRPPHPVQPTPPVHASNALMQPSEQMIMLL